MNLNIRELKRIISCLLLVAILTAGCAAFADDADTWNCEACGETGLSGNFCPECGAQKPSTSWVCPNCALTLESKFCPECGLARDNAGAAPTAAPERKSLPQMREDSEDTDMVFGTDYKRTEIKHVTFYSDFSRLPDRAYDISADENNKVWLWFEEVEKNRYDMFIAGDGGVMAPVSCENLFYNYFNAEEINFNNCFDTSRTTSMVHMISVCNKLTKLSGMNFDTSNVETMYFMFAACPSLETLDLSFMDTSNVMDFTDMFYNCTSLRDLDLSSFVIKPGAACNGVFKDCVSLPSSEYGPFAGRMPTATPRPTATPFRTATPAPKTYYRLARGDKNFNVLQLQTRLIMYGYLADGEADGSYGAKTAAAVYRFCAQNGFGLSGVIADQCAATPEVQRLLFEGNPVYYSEYNFPLVFDGTRNGEWVESGSKMKIRFKVYNMSKSLYVKDFEIHAYALDVDGFPIYEYDYYYEITKATVNPGTYRFSNYLVLPDRRNVAYVKAYIAKATLSDGTVMTNPSDNESEWTIKWNK